MLSCWEEDIQSRPTFKVLRSKLDDMLSAQGKNLYLDFCINPDKPCYTAEEDEQNPTSNGFLRVSNAGKRRSHHSMLGSNISLNPDKSNRSSYRQKSCTPTSPTDEKAHVTNPLHFFAEKGNDRRPASMLVPKGADRYVKDPSSLASPMVGSDGAINLLSSSFSHHPPAQLPPEITITETGYLS